MSRNTKEWIGAAFAAVCATALVGIVLLMPWPPCKPGDHGIEIGGVLLFGGCPEKPWSLR
jgi:hypothetical protein